MRKKKLEWIIFSAFFGAVFAIALVSLIIHIFPKKDENIAYYSSVASELAATVKENKEIRIDFAALQAKNPDTVAWVAVPGTNIDYPILRCPAGVDEDYYINHDFNNKQKLAGSVYIQYMNHPDFSDPNTVIYGHNMLNGSMFGTLKKFRNKDFFNKNQNIYIYTPGHKLTYKIFSAFYYDNRHILKSFDFTAAESFSAFIKDCYNSESKNIRKEPKVTADSKVITLSTCANAETQRYLVTAVLTEDKIIK